MSRYPIVLSESERSELRRIAAQYTSPYYVVGCARIALMAAKGLNKKASGKILSQIVSNWRKRFFEERLDGLDDKARPGN